MQLCRGRYCQEAVNSVKIVDSCPTSKTEWDEAARRKNCSKIASTQTCSPVDQFVYHCVINGYRNETLEVCASSRTILGKLSFKKKIFSIFIRGLFTLKCLSSKNYD